MTHLTTKSGRALILLSMLTWTNVTPSFGETFAQKHPRRAQVLRNNMKVDQRINKAFGNLGGKYGHLEGQNAAIFKEQKRFAQQNGGFITKGQQYQLNQAAKSVGKQTYFDNHNNQFVRNHPLRSQVLSGDANDNYLINHDAGRLGGQYNNLRNTQKSIAQQEQTDAQQNNGHITRAEQAQLDQQEGQLRQQINQDFTGK